MFLALPLVSSAEDWAGLVKCKDSKTCNWTTLLDTVFEVTKFVLYSLVLPIAAIMFAYAGFLLVTSGGNTSAKETAKSIFYNTVLGLLFALGAWLIVGLILSTLGWDRSWIGF